MSISEYALSVLEGAKGKQSPEDKFDEKVKRVMAAIPVAAEPFPEPIRVTKPARKKEPEPVILFHMPWMDETGMIHV